MPPDAASRRTTIVRGGGDPRAVAAAWHDPAPADPTRTGVVLAHGAGSDLDAPVLVAAATGLASHGHPVVRVNLGYRQRRSSGPPPRAEASIDDLRATWEAVVEAEPDRPWVLGGASYGGRVASLVAAAGIDVAGVLCWSYPLHPPGRPDRLRVAHLSDVVVPMLVVQGTDDPFGGFDDLRPHLARAGAPARVVGVAGADHGLHVPRTRAVDGRTHRVEEVVADVVPTVAGWLDGLGSRARRALGDHDG